MSTDYQLQNEQFIERVVRHCNDRGQRAELKRWWSPGTRHYAYAGLGHLGALDDERRTLTCVLYACHFKEGKPAHVRDGDSVGSAALKLAGGSPKATGYESMERHFRHLLAAGSLDDLGERLHRLIKRLERENIPLDYARLLEDLRRFGRDQEGVKTDWAKGFWRAEEQEQ
jgi:CRISPR type I-E-associated protein CasB/Cse2